MTWSDNDKADFRTKYLAFNLSGSPEVDEHRWPWTPSEDDELD